MSADVSLNVHISESWYNDDIDTFLFTLWHMCLIAKIMGWPPPPPSSTSWKAKIQHRSNNSNKRVFLECVNTFMCILSTHDSFSFSTCWFLYLHVVFSSALWSTTGSSVKTGGIIGPTFETVHLKFTLALALLTRTVRVWTTYWAKSLIQDGLHRCARNLLKETQAICVSLQSLRSVRGGGGSVTLLSAHGIHLQKRSSILTPQAWRLWYVCVKHTEGGNRFAS